jgi:hypothetical protein
MLFHAIFAVEKTTRKSFSKQQKISIKNYQTLNRASRVIDAKTK